MTLFASDLLLIICLVVGLALLIWEALMPGFGAAGIIGIVAEIIAIACAYVRHGLVFASLFTLAILLVIGIVVFLSYRSATRGRISKSALILKETESSGEGESALSLQKLVNASAVTVTPLRPQGFIEVEGNRFSAASTGEFLSKGQNVRVTGVSGNHVIVKPID